jgi:hypothetical protein
MVKLTLILDIPYHSSDVSISLDSPDQNGCSMFSYTSHENNTKLLYYPQGTTVVLNASTVFVHPTLGW